LAAAEAQLAGDLDGTALVAAVQRTNATRCCFRCESNEPMLPKTAEDYREALSHPGSSYSQEEMAFESRQLAAGQISYGSDRRLVKFPGVELPHSAVHDYMHVEFLGESRKHLKIFLGVILPHTGLDEKVFCARISGYLKNLMKINKDSCHSTISAIKKLDHLPAYSILRLVCWSWYIFTNAFPAILEIRELLPHLRCWIHRVMLVKACTARKFTTDSLEALDSISHDLSVSCCSLYPKFCSLKSHIIKFHLRQMIETLGPLRLTWCFKPENFNYLVKQLFVNTNNRETHSVMLERFLVAKLAEDFLARRGRHSFVTGEVKKLTAYGIIKKGTYVIKTGERFTHVAEILEFEPRNMVRIKSYPLFSVITRILDEFSTKTLHSRMNNGLESSVSCAEIIPVDVVIRNSNPHLTIIHSPADCGEFEEPHHH
jgi:hypothetical protein